MAMTPHEAARWYAERKIWIFPCHTVLPNGKCSCRSKDPAHKPGKHPRTQHGFKDASIDLEQIDRWWSQWPDANIGIATEATGWNIIDVDAAHGGYDSLAELEKKYGKLPETVRSVTGGGGAHIALNGAHLPFGIAIMAGIDIPRYIIAPPSNHVSGNTYEWEVNHKPGDLPVAPTPQWLFDIARESLQERRTDLDGLDGGTIPVGFRDDYLTSLAGTLRSRGSTKDEIYQFISTVYENRVEKNPPMSTADLKRIANSIGSKPPGGTFVNKGGKKSPEPGAAPKITTTFTAAELQKMILPEPTHTIPGVLSEGLGLLAGKPKSGKSWMAMGFCIALATGGTVMGQYDVPPGDVLYLALEDSPRRLRTRLEIMMKDQDLPERLTFATDWPKFDDGGIEALSLWMDEHPQAKLIVIDTLAKVRPRRNDRGNAYDEDYEHLGAIKELADRHRVCVLVIHHLRKMVSDDPLDLVSGTLAIVGVADTILILRRIQTAGNVDAQLNIRGRDIEDTDLALKFWSARGSWESAGDWEASSAAGHFTQIRAALEDGPLSLADLEAETGIDYKVLDKTVRRLVKSGGLRRVGRGVYGNTVVMSEVSDKFGHISDKSEGVSELNVKDWKVPSYEGLSEMSEMNLKQGESVRKLSELDVRNVRKFGHNDGDGKGNSDISDKVYTKQPRHYWEEPDDDDGTKPPTQPDQQVTEEKEWS